MSGFHILSFGALSSYTDPSLILYSCSLRHPGHMKALFFVMNDFILWSGECRIFQKGDLRLNGYEL